MCPDPAPFMHIGNLIAGLLGGFALGWAIFKPKPENTKHPGDQ